MLWLERFIESHGGRVTAAFTGATGVAGIIFGATDLSLSLREFLCCIDYVVFILGAYTLGYLLAIRKRVTTDDVSDSVVIIRPDDHLAHAGNRHARHYFGRRTIDFHSYRIWRQRNSLLCTCIVDKDHHRLYGFFDVFPLSDRAGARLRCGELGEDDILAGDIIREADIEKANYIYIASLAACVLNEYLEVRITAALAQFLRRFYPPTPTRVYMAFAVNKRGENVLRRNYFRMERSKELTKFHHDLFVLDAAGARKALERLRREHMVLSKRSGRSQVQPTRQFVRNSRRG
jgi:hypothetical protein